MKEINFNTTPFPMIMGETGNNIRVVTPEIINEGDQIEYKNNLLRVDKINVARKARGVYEDIERPEFYDMDLVHVGKVMYTLKGDEKVREVILNQSV